MPAVLYLRDRFLPPGAPSTLPGSLPGPTDVSRPLVPEFPAHATVALLDGGYLLGDGVFATLRGYAGICFRAYAHLETLARGARLFGLPLPCPESRLAELVDEAARRTDESDAYVRVTLTRGAPSAAPTLSILARRLDMPSDEDYANGITATIVTPRRIPAACLDPTIKTTSYAPQVLARREAHARGAAEGIQLALDGSVACGTMSNVFAVVGNELRTPALDVGCRDGVTRRAVLQVASEIDLTPRETRISMDDLERADEVFFTSTRIECLAVAQIDGRPIRGRTIERTTALRRALRALVARESAARTNEPRGPA